MSISDISTLVILGLNFSGIIWGASKISSSTKNLEKTAERVNTTLQDHNTRISRIEGHLEL